MDRLDVLPAAGLAALPRHGQERVAQVDQIDLALAVQFAADRLQVRAGAAAQIDPHAALRHGDRAVHRLAALQQPAAEVVVAGGLARIERFQPRRVVLAADRLGHNVVEDAKIGKEGHFAATSVGRNKLAQFRLGSNRHCRNCEVVPAYAS